MLQNVLTNTAMNIQSVEIHMESDNKSTLNLVDESETPTDVVNGGSQGITSFLVLPIPSAGPLYEMPDQPLLCLGLCWHSQAKASIV